MRKVDVNSTLGQRLNIVFKHLVEIGIIRNQQHFAEQIGYQRAFISQTLNEKENVPLVMMLAIYSRYDMFSLEWLMTGNGEQFDVKDKKQITYGTLSQNILATKSDIEEIAKATEEMAHDISEIKNKLGI